MVYVEPDYANSSLMECLLGSRTDYVLHHAFDGNSGLELCRRVKPDMVITEMRLPDMTAYDILQALRHDAAMASLLCVVFSGDAMPCHVENALAAGFDDYWTKPIDIWQLLQKIRRTAMKAKALYQQHGPRARYDTVAMQYQIPGRKFENKRPCLVR